MSIDLRETFVNSHVISAVTAIGEAARGSPENGSALDKSSPSREMYAMITA